MDESFKGIKFALVISSHICSKEKFGKFLCLLFPAICVILHSVFDVHPAFMSGPTEVLVFPDSRLTNSRFLWCCKGLCT